MKFRVKVVTSEKETKYYPEYFRWNPFGEYPIYIGWSCMADKYDCFNAAVFNTEQEAWDFIKSKQTYPEISYLYKEKNT